ncbi:MAG TPA: biliverdin-producing heme oxygenase [Coleofasciculaceae cyanobacterium]
MSHDLRHDPNPSIHSDSSPFPNLIGHNLASRLREGTRQSHTSAENTAYMKCFLKGVVVPVAFQKLLANLYWIYDAMEAEFDRLQDHPILRQIHFSELRRSENLAQDLAFFYGEDWQDCITPNGAGLAYVMRIHLMARDRPERLVAHAYVRYLGDLSGGQGLRKIVRSALNLPADRGTGLYEFSALPTPEAKRDFKMHYRDVLNALPLSETEVLGIIEEANLAFQLNCNLVHSLEPHIQAAIDPQQFAQITNDSHQGSTELVEVGR